MRSIGCVVAACITSAACLVMGSSAAAFAAPPAGGAHPGVGSPPTTVAQQVIASGTATYPYVRTPALAVTDSGTVIAAYDPRPTGGDLPNHMPLVIRRSTDGGRTWGPQTTVRSGPSPDGFSDPSLLVDRRTGRIFLFYAASVNEGFFGSTTGNNPDDPNILQADVSYSDDDGLSWTSEVITPQIKDPSWNGLFAASGEGIQLKVGPYAGRLVQQYVIADHGGVYAASAYSDDDGATWRMGDLVGPGMDENKTVQLANGQLLLDVRARPERLIAYSDNGGLSYTQPVPNPGLTDPADNGSVIRYAPDAPPGNPRSSWLLESNTDHPTQRQNLVVKLSCDDGRTWTSTRVVDAGTSAYSTLTNLPGGRFGLLYEAGNYNKMVYASFGRQWIRPNCASVRPAGGPIVAAPDATRSIPVTVTNTGVTSLPPSTLSLQPPAGWSTAAERIPTLSAGASMTVKVPVVISDAAPAGAVEIQATVTNGEGTADGLVPVTVVDGARVWSTDAPISTKGLTAVDESAHLPAVSSLTNCLIVAEFKTTQATPAGAILSAANSATNVQDVVVSVNEGHPYVEVRTGPGAYPVRLEGSNTVNDGQLHVVSVTTTGGRTVLGVDGVPIGTASPGGSFSSVPGLSNLTIGANVAATGTRWQFAGVIDKIIVTSTPS